MSPDRKRLRRRVEQWLEQWVEGSFPARCVRSFTRLGGLDRAMVIASQAFTTLIPLFIVGSAFLPMEDPDAVSDGMIRRFGLTGETADVVQQVFGEADPGSVGVFSLLLLVVSGVSFTRRMQRMYLRAWQVSTLHGITGSTHAALGLVALLVEITLLSQVHSLVGSTRFGWGLTLVTSALTSMVLWTSIPWLILGRRVEWRRLLPEGVLTGIAVTVYGVSTTFYMPRLIETYSDRYGLFGVTIALIGWLLCISVIVVAATAIATEVDRAPQRWAVRLRTRLGVETGAAVTATAPHEVDELPV